LLREERRGDGREQDEQQARTHESSSLARAVCKLRLQSVDDVESAEPTHVAVVPLTATG
jgi:hypothetical protein